MSLTYTQKSNLKKLVTGVIVAGVLSLVGWAAALVIGSLSPAQSVNTPAIRQVNATHFEQLDFGNGDPQLDHFCIGTTGFYINTSSGNMDQIVKDDSLCP